MIDTITLLLGNNMFTLFEPDQFSQITSRGGMQKLVLNPTKAERKQGLYFPSLTIVNRYTPARGHTKSLQIQISLPKMMYRNNFDELSETDFPKVVKKLLHQLKMRNVRVFEKHLRQSEVIGIHYGKNFVMQDGRTPKMVIDKIAQGDYSRRQDVEKVSYRNDGYGWKIHTNSYEVAFYDKKADLLRAKISERRSIESDSHTQLKIFDKPKRHKPLEVLRMEIRLNRKRVIKQVFAKIGIDTSLTFSNLFSETITQQVLLHYLDLIESVRPNYINYQPTGPIDLLAEIKINNPDLSTSSLLSLAFIKQTLDHGDTIGSIRQTIASKPSRQWCKLIKQAKLITTSTQNNSFTWVRSQISNYQPTKLADYKNQLTTKKNRIK